jgi:hypothetical protein
MGPSYRPITRAAARSLVHGTSVKLVVPKELHSSTARNSAPYPDGGADLPPWPGRFPSVSEDVWHPESPTTVSAAVISAPAHACPFRIANIRSSVTRDHETRQTCGMFCDIRVRDVRCEA